MLLKEVLDHIMNMSIVELKKKAYVRIEPLGGYSMPIKFVASPVKRRDSDGYDTKFGCVHDSRNINNTNACVTGFDIYEALDIHLSIHNRNGIDLGCCGVLIEFYEWIEHLEGYRSHLYDVDFVGFNGNVRNEDSCVLIKANNTYRSGEIKTSIPGERRSIISW